MYHVDLFVRLPSGLVFVNLTLSIAKNMLFLRKIEREFNTYTCLPRSTVCLKEPLNCFPVSGRGCLSVGIERSTLSNVGLFGVRY